MSRSPLIAWPFFQQQRPRSSRALYRTSLTTRPTLLSLTGGRLSNFSNREKREMRPPPHGIYRVFPVSTLFLYFFYVFFFSLIPRFAALNSRPRGYIVYASRAYRDNGASAVTIALPSTAETFSLIANRVIFRSPLLSRRAVSTAEDLPERRGSRVQLVGKMKRESATLPLMTIYIKIYFYY